MDENEEVAMPILNQEETKFNKGPKVRYPNIEKAVNGYVVEWSEQAPSKGMDHAGYIQKRMLFSTSEKEKAWDKYKELKMYCVENKNEDDY